EIAYDDAGNPFYQDGNGRWVPHPGVAEDTGIENSLLAPSLYVRPGKERAHADECIHRKGKENAVAAPKKWNIDTEDGKRGTKRKAPLDAEDKKPSKRGRPSGAGNYSHDDVMALLAFVEKELPIGQRGWQTVHTHYIKWARTHERPERSLKSLETKFKQLVKTTKPTGDAECPPEVERAHEVDYLINEKAGTRDLDDEEFADEVSDCPTHYSISSDDEPPPPPSTQPKVAVARPARTIAPMPRRNVRGTNGLDLQLRDALTTIETLRSQLIQAQQRTHDADRARD
ncbi:hypothetical protein BV22DRAFT_971252, partial [Leucogyrophana mollusca]